MEFTMSEKSKQDNDQSTGQGMQIDVGHLSVTGHVVFAGRDGSVNVSTGGDVEQTANTSLMVGGVEASREDYDGMVTSIRDVQKTINNEELEASVQAAAEHNLQTIETQLTAESSLIRMYFLKLLGHSIAQAQELRVSLSHYFRTL